MFLSPKRSARRAPGDHPEKTAFFTTGAEAVENAVKIARAATGRPGVIAFTGGFHGRTLMGMALTGKVAPYKIGFGPFPSDVFHAPFPNPLHGVTVEDSLRAIEHLFKADIDPKRVAAIIFEPVQGEGGFYQAPPEFVRALRKICNEHGILLIADEIQTGFARTGKLFAMRALRRGARPDDDRQEPRGRHAAVGRGRPRGNHGRSRARRPRRHVCGQPARGGRGACGARHHREEKLSERAVVLGDRLKAKLDGAARATCRRSPTCAARAAWSRWNSASPARTDADVDFTKRVQTRALERGLLLLVCGVYAQRGALPVPAHHSGRRVRRSARHPGRRADRNGRRGGLI